MPRLHARLPAGRAVRSRNMFRGEVCVCGRGGGDARGAALPPREVGSRAWLSYGSKEKRMRAKRLAGSDCCGAAVAATPGAPEARCGTSGRRIMSSRTTKCFTFVFNPQLRRTCQVELLDECSTGGTRFGPFLPLPGQPCQLTAAGHQELAPSRSELAPSTSLLAPSRSLLAPSRSLLASHCGEGAPTLAFQQPGALSPGLHWPQISY